MNSTTFLSIFIPTFNEEIHIERAITSAKRITNNIFVVDSYSNDKTVKISKDLGTQIFQYKWEEDSNWAKKFNWIFENVPFPTDWIMRLDADEYLTEKFITKMNEIFPSIDKSVTAISINRREYFMRRWMKHGGVYPKSMVRIIKKGKAFYEARWIDEHVEIKEGEILYLNCDICDDKIITLTQWISNHNNHSLKESIMLIDQEIGLFDNNDTHKNLDKKSLAKRKKKNIYAKLPLFWRAWAFFFYRYFIKMAFLDGKEGFLYTFLQVLWYRTIADAKVAEIYKECGKDKEKIYLYMNSKYKIKL